MLEALGRGAKGRLITSTYQNFTDIPSLRRFLDWSDRYPNFECRLDYGCFGDDGFHCKGYLFKIGGEDVFLVGSTNITRFALLKNVEWNVSISGASQESSEIISNARGDFEALWQRTLPLTNELIEQYDTALEYAIDRWDMDYDPNYLGSQKRPNAMQKAALKQLAVLRARGVDKALVVAATGSGKTYLAAFDAHAFNPRRLLFIVHRDTILSDALNTFRDVFIGKKTYGIFNGVMKDKDADFVFASNTALSMHLNEFNPDDFDYIIYDECHHATASTYQKIMTYFHPSFSLGLTATPERMDNEDVFDLFGNNIPFELRLRDAIINDLIVPFKYYGVRDEFVTYSKDDLLEFFNQSASDEHVDFVAEQIEKYRQKGKLKAIAFCRNKRHAEAMARALGERGYRTTALFGDHDYGTRKKAYRELQSNSGALDIICSVDILNEGIDIPEINMVLFLRPTDSQTIFIQQLGRGLRKAKGKNYLTVLDFIGNGYERSVQIVRALSGLGAGPSPDKPSVIAAIKDEFKSINIPGVEIHFDRQSVDEILNHIERTNFNRKDILLADYRSFKHYLGLYNAESYPPHTAYLDDEAAPDLMRFLKSHFSGSKNRSYYTFLKKIGEKVPDFTDTQVVFIDQLSEQLPLTRAEEFLILRNILRGKKYDDGVLNAYQRITQKSITNAAENLRSLGLIKERSLELTISSELDVEMVSYLEDLIEYGLTRYDTEFGDFTEQFKYGANYLKEKATLEITGKQYIFQQGTLYDTDNKITYLFVGLKKDEINEAIFAYKDRFLSPTLFQWESRNNTTFTNSEGQKLLCTKLVHLFVRRVDSEDTISLPFTYFGTGKLMNARAGVNDGKPTLVFDVELDTEVPPEYRFDFNVPEAIKA